MARKNQAEELEERRRERITFVGQVLADAGVAKTKIHKASVAVVDALAGVMGPIEKAARSDVENLKSTHPAAASLEQAVFSLAHVLDEGAGMASAAVAREMRTTLADLVPAGGDDDDLGYGGAE